MTDRSKLLALAEEVQRGEGEDNGLDVQVEVALFVPCKTWASARPNHAGTKVIYTDRKGCDMTHWAPDWTRNRSQTARDLRAQAEALA